MMLRAAMRNRCEPIIVPFQSFSASALPHEVEHPDEKESEHHGSEAANQSRVDFLSTRLFIVMRRSRASELQTTLHRASLLTL
jgi:hypothetical protein